ncbi:putative sporulation protein SpoIID [Prochlorococcus marinus str. MIT 9302]|uniref:Putative sporulation protein SpoIID n=1 Tax=Prochlorococcus marinus str. MIT 9302 TaxID=74545 RepID=A0A0A2A954_PROMR|nr:SpoIID/LytB domain-containing protein [Prochlorococcus marinus]KGF97029.1 putative sporulation protein SpoIID [Prochlorococcus marinus str. MIT 9302]
MILKIIKTTHKFCLISILIFCFPQTRTESAIREPIINVLILKDQKIRIRSDRSIPLSISGQRFSNKKIKGLTLKKQNNRTTLIFDKNKQKIFDLKNEEKFVVRSSDRRGIWVGQKRYAGKLNIFIRDNDIMVVNVLGIEKYLGSVVGSEMPAKWPLEALKAQAIASRTYALKQKGNPLYDIDSTNNNQVYIGLEAGTYKTKRAVDSTRSLVLTYKNKLINSLFHSSSAGMTENSQDVWKNKYPYLSSVKDFDKNNPKLRWNKKFSNSQLKKLFPRIGGIKKIEILNVTSTGRVKNVKIHGDFGTDQISGVDIRKRMNLKSTLVRFKFIEDNETKSSDEIPKLLSTNSSGNESLTHIVRVGDTLIVIADQYDVSVEEIVALNKIKNSSIINIGQRLLVPRNSLTSSSSEKILVVSGYGSGHGVGMSQWGAKYMANKGQKANAILKHFYKGVEIKPFKKYFL